MTNLTRFTICNGKYTYVLDENYKQYVLRYGEEWRDLTGDNFVCALAGVVEELTNALKEIRNADDVDLALDSQWPKRIAANALQQVT
jgi:hypothetical protein